MQAEKYGNQWPIVPKKEKKYFWIKFKKKGYMDFFLGVSIMDLIRKG